jgi:hypothetical protein
MNYKPENTVQLLSLVGNQISVGGVRTTPEELDGIAIKDAHTSFSSLAPSDQEIIEQGLPVVLYKNIQKELCVITTPIDVLSEYKLTQFYITSCKDNSEYRVTLDSVGKNPKEDCETTVTNTNTQESIGDTSIPLVDDHYLAFQTGNSALTTAEKL